jgi:signal transduction histidine kinase
MASTSPESAAVVGRLDGSGRLIAADPELETLQREAGSELGRALALPQIASVAQLARTLGAPVRRQAIAASSEHDIELWVNARPEGDEIVLSLEGWTVHAPAAPRFAAVAGAEAKRSEKEGREWATDEQLHITSLSAGLAELLGVDPADAVGAPLTRIVQLQENSNGELPLLSAAAAHRDFAAQPARCRSDESCVLLLSGEVVRDSEGRFGGFRGTAEIEENAAESQSGATPFDETLDELLASPIDRIIESAERIVARADGPLREDYASYGNDIASAARHLHSVVRAMGDGAGQGEGEVDLAALSAEAVIMLESTAEERKVRVELERPQPLRARGEERPVLQILVNLLVNAIRYSPAGGIIRLNFDNRAGTALVTVSDQGPGVAKGDEQRIFERFERSHSNDGGTGLGLAISRRLARSMGGDVTLDSAPGEGARFTLTLPAA